MAAPETNVTDLEDAMSVSSASVRSGAGISESRIPVPQSPGSFRRSASFRMRGEKFDRRRALHYPPITEHGSAAAWNDDPFRSPQPNRHLSLQSLNFPSSSRRSSGSFPQTPTPSPEDNSLLRFDKDDDLDSLRSFGSACSTMSCDHAYFARNGTTFSGRRMKYVVHCSSHSGEGDEYLTPTQRYNKQIRHLKTLLVQAQRDLKQKDQEIFQLTKEVVELRVFKASMNPSEDKTDSGELNGEHAPNNDDSTSSMQLNQSSSVFDENAEMLQELKRESPDLDGVEKSNASDVPSSLADSGHFEDLHLPRTPEFQNINLLQDISCQVEDREGERTRIVNMYEKRIEDLLRNHVDECQELKERHNDKVESLLQRLSDANSSYSELRSDYDRSQDKVRELEKQVESLRKGLEEQEEKNQNMYLKMYLKGQEAARFEHADQVLEFAHRAPNRVSVPELLQQLQVTESELENIKDKDYIETDKSKPCLLSAKEAVSLWLLGTRKAMYRRIVETRAKKGDLDPEITLQFLKSAIYYFLTDKENHQGHLNAIESILGYSDTEKLNIEKAYKANVKK